MTDRTPPWGLSTSPSLRGIRWKWQCKIDWPDTIPIFVPRLNPLTNGSLLVISFLTIFIRSLHACNDLIKIVKKEITNKDPLVKGFNLGTNIGIVSGQSILHCHFHLIPRREGDVDNPQGGVRSVIPNKQHYKRNN